MEMAIEVVDQLTQKKPWHRQSSNVAVGRPDTLDIGNEVLNKMIKLARDCIHGHQGVARVSAVLVAQGDKLSNCCCSCDGRPKSLAS
jgi:hypothetical protein